MHSEQIYKLDQLANERGQEIVRLRPYHCQYNVREHIWVQVKRELTEKKYNLQILDVKDLLLVNVILAT